MTTVASRIFRSSPQRSSVETWEAIVDLLTAGQSGPARNELLSIMGVASAVIAERGPQNASITVTCDGPRTRIYCLYDDDAVDGSDAKEDSLGYNPLNGNWAVSLPCSEDELPWIQAALSDKTNRISARDKSETLGGGDSDAGEAQNLSVNLEAFLNL
jgi:hypothetical protein